MQKGFANGLLANGSDGKQTVVVNPDLIEAMSNHLLS
jgi:hypothetical protein